MFLVFLFTFGGGVFAATIIARAIVLTSLSDQLYLQIRLSH